MRDESSERDDKMNGTGEQITIGRKLCSRLIPEAVHAKKKRTG